MGDYDLYQIEVSKNYGFNEWREDIQKLFRQAGITGMPTVFLLGDHQIKVNDRFANCLLRCFTSKFVKLLARIQPSSDLPVNS